MTSKKNKKIKSSSSKKISRKEEINLKDIHNYIKKNTIIV